jgi:DNA-binding NarL/FixJ family response regulator
MEKESTLRVLLVSDKVSYLRNYRAAFERIESSSLNTSFAVTELNAYDTALDFIKKMDASELFDVICLQINIPPGIHRQQEDGSNLGILLRRRFPEAIIILDANFSITYNYWNLLKLVDPQAIIGDDFDLVSELPMHLTQALKRPRYICPSMQAAVMNHLCCKIDLDAFERDLLFELSKGTRMAALPNILNMSISTIEKRKKRLKERFEVEGDDDSMLIIKARESGAL